MPILGRPAVRTAARPAPTPASSSSALGSRGSLPRELGRVGLDVIVLEALDRVGGRTRTDRRLGYDLELGGTWVHWVQPHTWAEMTRYGREITRSPAAGEAYWLGAGDAPRAHDQVPDRWAAMRAGYPTTRARIVIP